MVSSLCCCKSESCNVVFLFRVMRLDVHASLSAKSRIAAGVKRKRGARGLRGGGKPANRLYRKQNLNAPNRLTERAILFHSVVSLVTH